MVTPAPIAMRAPARPDLAKARSVVRTIVENGGSPSLTARITSVPPARKRAPRSRRERGRRLAEAGEGLARRPASCVVPHAAGSSWRRIAAKPAW